MTNEVLDVEGLFLYTGSEEGGCLDVGKIELTGYRLISEARLAQLESRPSGQMIKLLKEVRKLLCNEHTRTSEQLKMAERIAAYLYTPVKDGESL